MIDYHIHTLLSTDCGTSMMDMAKAAVQKGLKEICFTDHIDFDFPGGGYMVDFDEYEAEFEKVKAAFPGINISKGIEAGLEPHSFERYKEHLSGRGLDYIVGSVHIIYGYDPYLPGLWENVGRQQAFDEYARLSLQCLDAIDVYDALGHLGYIGKYCPYEDNLFRYSDYTDIIDTILNKLIDCNKGLEINTSGLISTGDLTPEKPIIERYFELGGELITLGSDAHTEENVGLAVKDTLEYLKQTGFNYICAYDKREPRYIPIP